MVSVPTQGEIFARFIDRLKECQSDAAMMAHLTRAMGGSRDGALADGWIAVSELLKRQIYQYTQLAKGHLQ